jgi:hypothetical protein
MPPKEGGLGYGSLLHFAQAGGYSGPSADAPEPAKDNSAEFGAWKEPKKEKLDRVRVLTIADILALPPPTPLIENVIMEGENFVLYGPPKKGKSLFTLDAAMSVAAGIPVLGHLRVYRHGPVVYMSSEGQSYLGQRAEAWMNARGINIDDLMETFIFITDVPLAGEPGSLAEYKAKIRAALGDRKPVLLVVDTYSRSLAGLDENNPASANLYDRMSRELMDDFECASFTIAHVGKDSKKGLRGSNATTANFDAFAELEEVDDMRRFSRVGRGDDSRPFGIKREITTWGENGRGETLKWAPESATVEKKGPAEDDPLTFKVVEGLDRLHAYGPANGRTVNVLAQEITPRFPNEADPEYERRVKTVQKALQRRANPLRGPKSLVGYAYPGVGGQSNRTLWYLPAEDEDAA